MADSYNYITEVLDAWLSAHLENTLQIKVNEKEDLNINSSLLRLENWIINWQKEKKINQRVNSSIFSENILNSIINKCNTYYPPVYYQLNFLYYLAKHYHPKKSLFEYIDSFIDEYKNQLSLADIVITDTGATRAKTNIRFALSTLREMGLVENKGLNGKRSLRPTIPGLVCLINIFYESEYLSRKVEQFKHHTILDTPKKCLELKHFEFDPTLFESLFMFKLDGHFYSFLDNIIFENSDKNSKRIFEKTMKVYIEFVQSSINIKSDGLEFTKDFAKKSKKFLSHICKQSAINEILHNCLMKKFQEIYKD